jgi:CHAD domain-containing protein
MTAYEVGVEAELPSFADARAGLGAEAALPVVLRSVYYDTADGRLRAGGMTLRRTTRTGATTWDLDRPARLAASVGDRSAAVPARVAELLLAWTGGDPLEPVATLRTRRTTWTVGDGAAEVRDDVVEQLDGRRVVTKFREVALGDGAPAAYAKRLAGRLEKAGAVRVDGGPVDRVRRLFAGQPRAPRLRKNDAAVALVAAALARGTAELLAADVAVRLGEPDAVHQLRVAVRRLRTALGAFGSALDPAWAEHLAGELAWLGRSLGAARDAEVVAERVAAAVADLGAEPLLADLAARRERAAAGVATTLAEPRYVALAALLRSAAADPPAAEGGMPPARALATRVVDAAWRDLERAVRRLDGKGDRSWHAVRISAKRARYAAEAASPVVPAAERLARAGAALQDALGTFHDTTLTRAALAEVAAEGDGAYGLVAGRVAEREERAADAAKAAFRPLWRRRAEPALKRWRQR